MGAVDVSRDGGFLQRSVFGGAAMVNDPIHSGTTSLGMFSGVKEELVGGMASVGNRRGTGDFEEIGARFCLYYCFSSSRDQVAYM
jgi:hypothetical protein